MTRRSRWLLVFVALSAFSCARPIARTCRTNAECGDHVCAAGRCEATRGEPLVGRDERLVVLPKVFAGEKGHILPLVRKEFVRGEAVSFQFPWPEDKNIHEAYLLLRVDDDASDATLELAAVRAPSSAATLLAAESDADRVLFARAEVRRGDTSVRVDLSGLPSVGELRDGQYSVRLQVLTGRLPLLLPGSPSPPMVEVYFGGNKK